MIDTGEYRNDIDALSAISIKEYERIFKVFKQSLDDKEFYTYNILKKIDFPVIDSSHIQFYSPPHKMALSIISWNIYKDMSSWWIIYLLNREKFDRAPFTLDGGVQVKYISNNLRTLIYADITNATVFGGRHF